MNICSFYFLPLYHKTHKNLKLWQEETKQVLWDKVL